MQRPVKVNHDPRGCQAIPGESSGETGAKNAERVAIRAQTTPFRPARLVAFEKMQTREKKTRRARLEKILVPVDFSPAAREAVGYASDLAKQHQSRIVLLHVVTSSEPDHAPEAAKQELARLCKSARVPPGRCTLLVRAGVPFFEITQSANEIDVDLIVVGRRQQLSADSLGDGHTSERIARYATCPVLLVRESVGKT